MLISQNNSSKMKEGWNKASQKIANLFDSQRKFVGKTLSQMKREIVKTLQPYDLDKINDPRGVVEYLDEIHGLLLKQEISNWSFFDYMIKTQRNKIGSEHRKILINFLTSLHYSLKIQDDKTLFL